MDSPREDGSPRHGSRDRRGGSGSPRRASRSRSGSRGRGHGGRSGGGRRGGSRDRYRDGGGRSEGGRDREYDGGRRGRSRSKSPMSSRRRHNGTREAPSISRCLGIFGLSIYTQERDLKEVFGKYGKIQDVQVVYDAQTGRSRGFCFVYFEQELDAKEVSAVALATLFGARRGAFVTGCSNDFIIVRQAKERCNGIEIDGRKIRVDFSITQRAHTPTPGIYMGKPT